jgi:choice-of-anchor A domain-containing protein
MATRRLLVSLAALPAVGLVGACTGEDAAVPPQGEGSALAGQVQPSNSEGSGGLLDSPSGSSRRSTSSGATSISEAEGGRDGSAVASGGAVDGLAGAGPSLGGTADPTGTVPPATGTIDVGTGGEIHIGTGGMGSTFDTSAGGTVDTGSGGTTDTGAGGTVDTGAGGTVDTGAGGTIDQGTGGTTDNCIPACVPDVLGWGESAVNVVVFDSVNAAGCDTEGRMWIGNDANLSGYGVGAQLSTCDATEPVLVVGGDLQATGSINGRVWVGGNFSGVSPVCGGVWGPEEPPVDFTALEELLTSYSELLADYPSNGAAAMDYGTLVLTGSDPEMNVFQITGADLATGSITIDVPPSSTVVVNVTGASAAFAPGTTTLPDGVKCGSGAVALDDFCNQLVWNLPNATELTVNGHGVQGSLLAPRATLAGNADVNGTVIVRALMLTACLEMHPHYFSGCLCTAEVDSPYACCP